VLEGRDTTEYVAVLDSWLALPNSKRRHAFFAQLKAEIAAFNGLAEPAILAIVEANELGLTDVLWIDRCPLLDFVRNDPRFVAARSHVAARAEAILAAIPCATPR
jgi:serine/threonine-protein kinase